MLKGYDIGCGWCGQMPSSEWRTFATEDDYLIAYREALPDS